MSQVIIENPVINTPFVEPKRHFRFGDEGITDEVVEARRVSSYFIPIARPKKKGKQIEFDTEWTKDRIEENRLVNQIRQRVKLWREGGYVGVTPTTARLLQYWTNPNRERKLFFCQVEALETAIYLTEVAKKYGDAWIENHLCEANDTSNPGLPRIAFKMATGSGKTVVMTMLIAWHALNKFANAQDARFRDDESMSLGLAGRAVTGSNVPTDPTVRSKPELWDSLAGHLGQASSLRIMATSGWPVDGDGGLK